MKQKRKITTVLSFLVIFSLIFNNIIFAAEIPVADQLGNYDTSKNFGVANDFNVFILGDMVKGGADAEGRVAVGGNATITNYSIGSRLPLSTVRADLIVGGDISIDSTAFNEGNIVISPTSKIIKYNNVWKNNGVQQSAPYMANLIDFQAAKTYLTNASAYWGGLSNNGNVSVNSGQLTLKGNDSTLNVFNFNSTNISNSGKSLSDINGITIDVPTDSSVIINVLGDTVTFGSYAMQDVNGKSIDGSDSSVKAGHILWNFPSSTSISCDTIIGSVLAPSSEIKINGSGHVAGNLIANSLSAENTGSFETHIQVNGGSPCLFNGTLPSIPTAPVVKGSITVKYVDENNNPIASDTVMSDLDIKDYTLNSKTIEGYDLNDTATKTVTLTDANNTATVIFKYTKEVPAPAPVVKGSVTVKYVDENNNPIAADTVMSDLDIKDYTLNSETINGYKLNDTTTKTVTLTDTNNIAIVIFKYTKEVPTPVAATGALVDGKTGQPLKPIESTVTRDADGKESVNVKAADAIAVKQPDGNVSPIVDLSNVTFLPDKNTGANIAIVDGKVQVSGLSDGSKAAYDIYYDLGNGEKIKIGTINVQVASDGNVNITSSLIDPYGVVTDSATGNPITGAKIDIYYADTNNNKANGKIPDTEVNLPIINSFQPNSNRNPQYSDSNGNYGFMVFPNTDYYIIVTKDGYEQYKSPIISVKQDLVVWNISMKKSTSQTISQTTNQTTNKSTNITSVLPKTGSTIDMLFLEAAGVIMIAIGIRLTFIRKQH